MKRENKNKQWKHKFKKKKNLKVNAENPVLIAVSLGSSDMTALVSMGDQIDICPNETRDNKCMGCNLKVLEMPPPVTTPWEGNA